VKNDAVFWQYKEKKAKLCENWQKLYKKSPNRVILYIDVPIKLCKTQKIHPTVDVLLNHFTTSLFHK